VALHDDTTGENWADRAEDDLGHVVAKSYLPLWLSAPAWSVVAWGATAVDPPILHAAAAAGAACAIIALGVALRRLPRPTLLRFWSALIAALAGFIAALLLTLNTDSLMLTTWATLVGSLGGYSIVMAARRDTLTSLLRS